MQEDYLPWTDTFDLDDFYQYPHRFEGDEEDRQRMDTQQTEAHFNQKAQAISPVVIVYLNGS